MQHNPPQVLTVAAITCRQCGGEESYHEADGSLSWCHICENGYEKVMVPAADFTRMCVRYYNFPGRFHAAVVRLAEATAVRLPVLTHNTSTLPVHLLPTVRRIPLVAAPAQTIPAKNAK